MLRRLLQKLTKTRVPIVSVTAALQAARRESPKAVLQRVTDPATNEQQVRETVAELSSILDAGFEVQVTLTQLGLDFSIALVMESLLQLLERGGPQRTLWVEMESSDCHDVTHELLRRIRLRYSNIELSNSATHLVRYTPEATS
jgi:hypothetical protein